MKDGAIANGVLPVSHATCHLRRDECLKGRRWVVALIVCAMLSMVSIAASSIAADRARMDDHERRISRMEAMVEANTGRLKRIEDKMDRMLELMTEGLRSKERVK